LLTSSGGKITLGLSRSVLFNNALSSAAAENNKIEEGVSAKTVGTMD
jgi:hypothetical protein